MAMSRGRFRDAVGIYLAAFFVAVAASRHDHVNGLADILLDQPSDSGEIAESDALPIDAGPGWYSEFLVDDDPCLACFNSDFISTAAPMLAFMPHLERFEARPRSCAGRTPWVPLRGAHSRAPPPSLS
ncbi:MAG: hypothetical protein M3167_18080 [Acidobacteriota bacterium]|nr:hypothetical protein [Acidobacteriota bacterium]